MRRRTTAQPHVTTSVVLPAAAGATSALDRAVRVAGRQLRRPCAMLAVGRDDVRRITGDGRVPAHDTARALARATSPALVADGDRSWFGVGVDLRAPRAAGALVCEGVDATMENAEALRDLGSLVSSLVRSERHAERTAAARELLATAAHDLRSPLAVLRVGLDTLTAPDHAVPPAQRSRIGRMATRQADRMATMLDQLLTLDGVGTADTSTEVDLQLLVAHVLESNRLVHGMADLSLRLPEADEPIVVTGNEDLLARLLSNLIGNAALHGGPHVEVAIGRDGGRAVITVDDDGPGMPAGTALDGGAAARADGHGLGLLICMKVVARHGGTIEHRPLPAGGTRLLVQLPLHR